MTSTFILPFNQIDATSLPRVGGKGANLGEMIGAGFPVPPGFCITTDAFQLFLDSSGFADELYDTLDALPADDLENTHRAGEQIRTRLSATPIPPEIEAAILRAWEARGTQRAYAVRSSATAEDLPTASFAGQQDTFLNVKGRTALLESVRGCWVSLFTDRAIHYRAQNGFAHRDVLIAVVVQRMIAGEVSGILFTADPVSGQRDTISIDASYGLGEALVAGLVTPDLYRVDKRTMTLLDMQIADKETAILPVSGGGTIHQVLTGDQRKTQALSDDQILALAKLGTRIETHYDAPQDIEWTWEDGRFWLVQTRPITSLFPIPAVPNADPDILRVYFSFASVQGIFEPITPLGRDTIRLLFAGAAQIFGLDFDHHTQPTIKESAERLWVDMTGGLRHPLGSHAVPRFIGVVDPDVAHALNELQDDPRLGAGSGHLRFTTVVRMVRFLLPLWFRAIWGWLFPARTLARILRQLDADLSHFRADIATLPDGSAYALDVHAKLVDGFRAFPILLPGMLPGFLSLFALNRIASHVEGASEHVMNITRGMPHNVTTEMDLTLWDHAQTIRNDEDSARVMRDASPAELAEAYHTHTLPPTAQRAINAFLDRYGARGVGEIDFGRARWREDPTNIIGVLQSYLRIEDEAQAPNAVFRQAEQSAEAAIASLEAAVRRGVGGRIRARLVRALAERVRTLAGLRESPKFHIIQKMDIIRQNLLERAEAMATRGLIDQPDDIFFLTIDDLATLKDDEQRDFKPVIADRRAAHDRELGRKRIPRLLLSDGRTIYEGAAKADAPEGALAGSPVSAGVVEGVARVVTDPQHAELLPGEIMICVGTDPAWTPLFLSISGLVMEMGGLMTHGSVVAREYGIPAVVGVHDATHLIQTGQRVRVHGDQGYVEVLDSNDA